MTEPAPAEVPQVTEAVVETISAQCPEVSDEHVAMVLAAWNTVISGEPLGTIKKDPVTGNFAVRVSEDGVHKWKVTAPDGGQWSDMQPTLAGWDTLA